MSIKNLTTVQEKLPTDIENHTKKTESTRKKVRQHRAKQGWHRRMSVLSEKGSSGTKQGWCKQHFLSVKKTVDGISIRENKSKKKIYGSDTKLNYERFNLYLLSQISIYTHLQIIIKEENKSKYT